MDHVQYRLYISSENLNMGSEIRAECAIVLPAYGTTDLDSTPSYCYTCPPTPISNGLAKASSALVFPFHVLNIRSNTAITREGLMHDDSIPHALAHTTTSPYILYLPFIVHDMTHVLINLETSACIYTIQRTCRQSTISPARRSRKANRHPFLLPPSSWFPLALVARGEASPASGAAPRLYRRPAPRSKPNVRSDQGWI